MHTSRNYLYFRKKTQIYLSFAGDKAEKKLAFLAEFCYRDSLRKRSVTGVAPGLQIQWMG